MAKKKDDRPAEPKKPSCTFAELSKLGPQPLKIGDQIIGQVEVREFSTKSYGMSFTGKASIQLPDEKLARCQCSVNLIVINSAPVAGVAATTTTDSEAA